DRHEMSADTAAQRRRHLREFEIELGIADRRLGGLDRCHGAAPVGGALIDALDGAELRLLQLLRAPQLRVGERRPGLRGVQLRDRLIEPDLEWARVDGKKRVALLDDLAVAKADRGQLAADLGTQFDAVDRRELSKEGRRATYCGLQRLADR